MRTRHYAVLLALGLAAVPLAVFGALAEEAPPKAAAKPVAVKSKAGPGGACTVRRSRSWAPTETTARLQAWEVVAQATGNWPFVTDTFRNERYDCAPERGGWRCQVRIDVCKKA